MTKRVISENLAKNIYLAIGSNLGNRKLNIHKAKYLLDQNNVKIIQISNFYETPSWPNPKNPMFLNIVLQVECIFKPLDLLKICKCIELKLGRKNDLKNSPRVCDIDIIDYNGLILNSELILPHKLMHKRNFVLLPLFEVNNQWIHPILRLDIKSLIFSLSNKDIRSIKQI